MNLKQLKGLDIELVRGELSRRSLKEFIRIFWHTVEPGNPFQDGWVIDAICDHLANLKDISNLLINCPPRIGKSNIVAVFFPAWQWLHRPAEQLFYTSYAIQLAERDSVKCRRLIDSDLYQKCFGNVYSLAPDQNTKRRFDNSKAGYRLVGSIGGSTTGEGGSIIVCDDPHSVDESESTAKRENAVRWFAETWLNRLNPGGTGRVVVGQRIHRDDLSGHILEHYKEEWCHLNLPYEYRTSVAVPTKLGWTDPRKEEGQPLWPERFTELEIRQQKKRPKAWSSQYNQNPIDIANSIFKPEMFRSYECTAKEYISRDARVNKADCWRIVTADPALSTNDRSDYTAILVADISRSGEIILLDLIRQRLGGTKIVPQLIRINEMYQPAYMLIEDAGFQSLIIEQAKAEGLAVRGIKPANQDKEARSIPLQVKVENGQVWFPMNANWTKELETELIEFPQGRHDDIVDALSYMAMEVSRRVKPRPINEPTKPVKTNQDVFNEALMQGLWR